MTSNAVSICNRALGHVGHSRRINALDEASPEAEICNELYDDCRREVLSSHAWRFAVRTSLLSRLEGVEVSPYAYAYAYPSNCLHPLGLLASGSEAEVVYEVREEGIVTDLLGASMKYVVDVTDPAKFDKPFTVALTWYLAAELSSRLTGAEGKTQFTWSMYMRAMSAAIGLSSSQARKEPVRHTSLKDSRRM